MVTTLRRAVHANALRRPSVKYGRARLAVAPKDTHIAAAVTAANKKKTSRRGSQASSSSSSSSIPSSPQHSAAAAATEQPDDLPLQSQEQEQEQKQQQQQQHSAAAAAAAPTAEESQDEEMSTAAPDEESKVERELPATAAASASAAGAPAMESPPELGPAEQKMLDTILSVRQRLDAIEASLPPLVAQMHTHAARLCAFRLARHYRSPTLNAVKLLLSHKSLRYHVGLIDEQCMQAIFRLDSLQTDDPLIRKERKATVARGNKIIAESVQLCKKIDKLQRWLPSKEQEQQEERALADVMVDGHTTPEPPHDAHMRPDTPSSTDEEAEAAAAAQHSRTTSRSSAASHSRPASPAAATTRSAPPSAAAAAAAAAPPTQPAAAPAAPEIPALLRKYAHLQLPKWRGPTFRAEVHPYSGSLLITADLSGVRSDDVTVNSDAESRMLTIRGVKLPRRRPVQQYDFFGFAPPVTAEPFGYFEKQINFSEIDPRAEYQLAGMTANMNAEQELIITVPRAPVRRVAPQPPQPQPRRHAFQQPQQQQRRPAARAPVSMSSGHDDDDEEDEADSYSHPYGYGAPNPFYQQARAAPRAAPRYAPAAAPSFFGSSGWW